MEIRREKIDRTIQNMIGFMSIINFYLMRKLISTSLLLMYISTMAPTIFAEDALDASVLDIPATQEVSTGSAPELLSAPAFHRYTSNNPMECLLTKWMIESNGTMSLDTLNRYYNDMSLACQDEDALNSASESGVVQESAPLDITPVIPEFKCGDSVSYGEYSYPTILMPDKTCWTLTNMKHLSGTGDSWNYGDTTANLPTDQTGSTFGRLYTWHAAMGLPEDSTSTGETSSGVCALLGTGWSLPTSDDWSSLEIDGATGWMGNQILGIGTSLPGARTEDGVFDFQNELGFWWTQTAGTSKTATTRSIDVTDFLTYSNDYTMTSAISVHCIKR